MEGSADSTIVDAFGLKYVVDRNASFIVEEAYEPFMKDVLKRLGEGDVFVDVGAHVGKYSFYASRLVGDSGLVIAIEPHPKNMKNLKKGIRLNGLFNVVTVQKACSNYRGSGFLREDRLSAKHELAQKTTELRVDVDTVDNILHTLRIKTVDMVKIDVNGYEYQVLQGMRKAISEFKPQLIVEVNFGNKTKTIEHLNRWNYKPTILSKTKRYFDLFFST
jgi:FkbM family methyltransferase